MHGPRKYSVAVHKAFTLIEVLTIVAVVSLLLGLIIPAAQSAREAMRRTQCKANLRQLGIAFSSYASLHNTYPPNSIISNNKHYSINSGSSFLFLLAFMDQLNLYNSINCSVLTADTIETPLIENRTVRNTRLSALLCPSDGESNHLNSYRLNRGTLHSGTGFSGPFGAGTILTPAAISDGLSNTAFASERIAGSYQSGLNDVRRDIKHPAGAGGFQSDESFIEFCLIAEAQEWRQTAGRFWFYSNVYDTAYNHYGVPNDSRPTCTGKGGNNRAFNPARSYHSNSVNVLYGDGRVESIQSSIATKTWQSIGTHSSGD